jgi:hypothetical protein
VSASNKEHIVCQTDWHTLVWALRLTFPVFELQLQVAVALLWVKVLGKLRARKEICHILDTGDRYGLSESRKERSGW